LEDLLDFLTNQVYNFPKGLNGFKVRRLRKDFKMLSMNTFIPW